MRPAALPLTCLFLAGAGAATGVRAGDAAAELGNMEAHYAEDRAAALRLVLARYLDELDALQKKLIAAGDTPGASRVQLEREKVLPALGVAQEVQEGADEFAFDDALPATDPKPLPAAPITTPAGLDAVLKSILPAEGTGTATSPTGAAQPATVAATAGRPGKRLLRMSTAQLLGSYDPLYPYVYWSAGRSASWTINDLPPGFYKLQLRYACDDKEGGGKLLVKFAGNEVETPVTPTGNWKRKRDLEVGPFNVTGNRADLTLTPAAITPGASYLMDLTAVLLVPVPPP